MGERFLSSEEYDERAHRLYNDGQYDEALRLLKEGLALYPEAVELYVGLGYARFAREEYVWARHAFEKALVLDGAHEDALVGLGETLLKFGEPERAIRLFGRVKGLGYRDDQELMLAMGRALYREGLYQEARDTFAELAAVHPDSPEALASLGYTAHRLGDDVAGRRHLRRALKLHPDFHEVRVYLGHVLYDQGNWEGALRELERVPPSGHWDPLAVWRVIELLRALRNLELGDAAMQPWEDRLAELEGEDDPIDRLLAEVEAGANLPDDGMAQEARRQLELFAASRNASTDRVRRVRAESGRVFTGTWYEIVRQMRDAAGFSHETVPEYMRRLAEGWQERTDVVIPFSDPEGFIRAADDAGFVRIESGEAGGTDGGEE